jgi:hypothetical protein
MVKHMCSGSCTCRTLGPDRHPKWRRVEPGTVIPAGQPYRVEWTSVYAHTMPDAILASERVCNDHDMPVIGGEDWFVDSSWKPPLVLPTEPTWGIVAYASVSAGQLWISKFHRDGNLLRGRSGGYTPIDQVADFIPLTDEQVARIEAAR